MKTDDMTGLVSQLAADFTPRAHLYAAAEDLYAQRSPAIEAKLAAMTVKQLKAYCREKGFRESGISVRAHYLDLVRQRLMKQCADDSGYTAAAGYPVGRPWQF
jgi:hypothetical protein